MKRAIALFALIAGSCAFPPANVYGSPGQDVTQAIATERQNTVPSDSPELQTEELSLSQHWELANELAKTGDLTRAAAVFESAWKRNPDIGAVQQLAWAYALAGRARGTLYRWLILRKREPQSAAHQALVGMLQLYCGQRKRAEANLRSALPLCQTWQELDALSSIYGSTGLGELRRLARDRSVEIRSVQEPYLLPPDPGPVWQLLYEAQDLARAGQVEAAITAAEKGLTLEPTAQDIQYTPHTMAMYLPPDKVPEYLRHRLLQLLAGLYLRAGEEERGHQMLQQTVAGEARPELALARALERTIKEARGTPDWDEIIRLREADLTNHPDDPGALSTLAECYSLADKPDKAIQLLQRGLQLTADYQKAGWHKLLTEIYRNEERHDEALRHYAQWLRVVPACDLPGRTEDFADYLTELGQQRQAMQVLKEYLNQPEVDRLHFRGLVHRLLRLAQQTDSLAQLRAEWKVDLQAQPDNCNLALRLARVHGMLDDEQAALDHYRMASKLAPDDWRVHLDIMGMAYADPKHLGRSRPRLERADAAYQFVIDEARLTLRLLGLDQPRQYVWLLDTIGIAHLRRGEWERAVEIGEQMLFLDSGGRGRIVEAARQANRFDEILSRFRAKAAEHPDVDFYPGLVLVLEGAKSDYVRDHSN